MMSRKDKKDRKKFKDTRFAGILATALDATGTLFTPIAPVTNFLSKKINNNAVPVLTVSELGKIDEITPKGERNNTKTVFIWIGSIMIVNALSEQFFNISIPVKQLISLAIQAFSN